MNAIQAPGTRYRELGPRSRLSYVSQYEYRPWGQSRHSVPTPACALADAFISTTTPFENPSKACAAL